MTNAVVALISSVAGGLLVLAGQYFARRSEDRRQWLLRLHESAGDLATSYLEEAARLNDLRRRGPLLDDALENSTYVVDRQRAKASFQTLPWSWMFEEQGQAIGTAIEDLWDSALADEEYDDFAHSLRALEARADEFTSAVRWQLVRSSGIRWAPRP